MNPARACQPLIAVLRDPAHMATLNLAAWDVLLRQASAPVLWEDSIRVLQDAGVDTFVEVGPGKVLCGLIKRIVEGATLLHVEDERSLAVTVQTIKAH